MLNGLTRKFCPFLTLALATISCGKKITDPKSGPSRTTENQEPSSTVMLTLDGSTGSSTLTYKMPRNGRFELPDQLRVTGNKSNQIVEVRYDVDPYDSDLFEFKCSYSASTSEIMRLNKCESWYGGDFGDLSGITFGFKKDTIFEMRFGATGPHDLKVNIFYDITWL